MRRLRAYVIATRQAALVVASAIAVAAVGGGVYCAVTGNIAGAGILLGGTVAVIIGAFLKIRVTR